MDRGVAASLLAACLAAAGCVRHVPVQPCTGPQSVRVARPRFDGDAAWALLRHQTGFGPRVPGQTGHARQLAWMREYLSARADTVQVQRFQHVTRRGDTLHLSNLFARFRPALPRRVLLVAHWDTRPGIPGANDGASGTAVLLQLAQSFREQPPPIGVDLLFTDGEDFGPGRRDMLLGARFFAAHPPPGPRPRYGVLVDMVADRWPEFPVERYSRRHAPEVVERVWSVAAQLGYACVFPRRAGRWVADDHLPLNRAGIPTANIIDFEYGPGNRFWHTPQDRVENTAPAGLYLVGETLSELVFRGG